MKIIGLVFVFVLLETTVSGPVPYYQPLTEEEIARLEAWTPDDQNMWQLSGQFEGDMVLTPDQRNGLINRKARWPKREIPYQFSDKISQSDRKLIAKSLSKEFAKTCLKIRPKTQSDKDYVYITSDKSGCWSKVGRQGGRQVLNLSKPGCLRHGIIVHEFLHAAGFYHQQSSTDRDKYVTIMWKNIKKGNQNNFNKYGSDLITSFGEKYDYGSIMHYDKMAFSANGKPTIVPKNPKVQIGQRVSMSKTDIRKVNKMYRCK